MKYAGPKKTFTGLEKYFPGLTLLNFLALKSFFVMFPKPDMMVGQLIEPSKA